MSRSLWLDHCLRLSDAAVRGIELSVRPGPVKDELRRRIRVELSLKEYDQLALELNSCYAFRTPEVLQGRPDEITLHGVAFVPKDAEYTEKLRTDLLQLHVENAHLRGLLYDENRDVVRSAEPAGRRALDRGMRRDPSNQPGTNRRGPT